MECWPFNYGFNKNRSGFNNNGLHDLTYLHKNKLSSDRPLGFNDEISSMNPINNIPGEVSTDDFDIIGTNDEVVFVQETKESSQSCNSYSLNSRLNPTYTNKIKDPFQVYNNSHLNSTCTYETKTSSQSTNNYLLNPTYKYGTKAPSQLCNNYLLNLSLNSC